MIKIKKNGDSVWSIKDIEKYLEINVPKRMQKLSKEMTPRDLKRLWKSGAIDHGDVCDLLGLAFLLPESHPYYIDL